MLELIAQVLMELLGKIMIIAKAWHPVDSQNGLAILVAHRGHADNANSR